MKTIFVIIGAVAILMIGNLSSVQAQAEGDFCKCEYGNGIFGSPLIVETCSTLLGPTLGYKCYTASTCPNGPLLKDTFNTILRAGSLLVGTFGLIYECDEGLVCCTSAQL